MGIPSFYLRGIPHYPPDGHLYKHNIWLLTFEWHVFLVHISLITG